MNEIPAAKTSPAQPSSTLHQPPSSTAPPAQNPPPQPASPHHSWTWFPFLMFIIGTIGGILLFITFPRFIYKSEAPSDKMEKINNVLTLPKDAALIEECVDNKGALYASPNDLPDGPIYMVYQNKVIGMEYQISQDDLAKRNITQNLKNHKIQINHIATGYLLKGPQGLAIPHNYIALYTVDPSVQQSITCPKPTSALILEISPSITITASPQPLSDTTPQVSITPISSPASNKTSLSPSPAAFP